MTSEEYFLNFRKNIIGIDSVFISPYGEKKLVYADWTASGRLYEPIEKKMHETFAPFVGNTHSESTITGSLMTNAYHNAHAIIKKHVNADENDALLFVGTGMTAAVNKFQRILGLKIPDKIKRNISFHENERPVVFVTHMEHHSNQTSWEETIADVHIMQPAANGLVDTEDLQRALEKYKNRTLKIGSFTACSNVTGISAPYYKLAKIMHEHGGIVIIDFAACAPYFIIDMHPADPLEKLDVVTFSPHKFLGGPGSPGVIIFDKMLYNLEIPDQPGGGTVLWTNAWGEHRYYPDIELREDGGTPGFLQAIKSSLAVNLKDSMGTDKIHQREKEIVKLMFEKLREIPELVILADHIKERLAMFSFYFEKIHYNLVVKILNDRFGIQTRGGCSCAGTYGHYLLHVDRQHSKEITNKIDAGDLSAKPGWVRVSLHPTTTNEEIEFITDALKQIRTNIDKWKQDYSYSNKTNEFHHVRESELLKEFTKNWFIL